MVYTKKHMSDKLFNTDDRDRKIITPARSGGISAGHRESAANIAREKINRAYQQDSYYHSNEASSYEEHGRQQGKTQQKSYNVAHKPTTEQSQQNVYQKTAAKAHTNITQEQWQHYHSSWQKYYQNYFQSYYSNHIHAIHSHARVQAQKNTLLEESLLKQKQDLDECQSKTLNQKQSDKQSELDAIKGEIKKRASKSASKVKSSQHFVPVVTALVVVFLFLAVQNWRVVVANAISFTSPGQAEPQNIITDVLNTQAVSNDPRLIIPKINIDIPVDYDTTPDYDSQMKAMENGAAWFGVAGANSKPGQIGNTVISAHSSNGFLESGNYKFIFAHLDKLKSGDVVYLNYKGTRYSYSVTKKEVVLPTDVDALIYETDKPVLTLITCTPLGTSEKRLLVTAEQISPSYADADKPDASEVDAEPIPGNAPTLFERLFGG